MESSLYAYNKETPLKLQKCKVLLMLAATINNTDAEVTLGILSYGTLQHYKVVEVGTSGGHLLQPLLKQGHREQVAQDHAQAAYRDLPRRESPPLWASCSHHLQSNSVFPNVQIELMGNSIEGHTEVYGDNIHGSPLVHQAGHFIVEAYQVGQA